MLLTFNNQFTKRAIFSGNADDRDCLHSIMQPLNRDCFNLWLLLFIALLSIFSCGTISAQSGHDISTTYHKVGFIEDERINEASGMAMSNRRDDMIWIHNDSGDGPFLYAVSTTGKSLGRVQLVGIIARDWEDMASFMWNSHPYLLIADVGDNKGIRPSCVLHLIKEPIIPPGGGTLQIPNDQIKSIVFTYEDGPRDCEAVAVDPISGLCFLLSKRDEIPRLYQLSPFETEHSHPMRADFIEPIRHIPAPDSIDLLQPYGRYRSQPTAMDISDDGRQLVILTYKNAYLYENKTNQKWHSILRNKHPFIVKMTDTLFNGLLQRESICFGKNRMILYTTSEKRPSPLFRIDLAKQFIENR